MIRSVIFKIFIALLILFFQVTVVNQFNISAFVIPFVYPVIILGIPRAIDKVNLLLLGFFVGLAVDFFSNTGGAHAMGMTVLAFVRPYLLASIGPSDSGSENIRPTIYTLGISSYAVYTLILLVLHHFVVFFMEVFSFTYLGETLIRVLLSCLASTGIIILLQYILEKKEN